MQETLTYLTGFGSYFESEAKANTLPLGQNSPQHVAHGLYAEQLSGSAFTAPRHRNLRSWLYRIQPSVVQGKFSLTSHPSFDLNHNIPASPEQFRWQAMPYPQQPTDFIQGLMTFAHTGHIRGQGAAVHHYAINANMTERFFYNADGDFLLVPEQGALLLDTEFGRLAVAPNEIAVIPRGIKFQVQLLQQQARGYVCENLGAPFILPELGPIGANGLANPRDFQVPTACYQQAKGDFELLCKFNGRLWSAPICHNPLDVVAWHGNYVPYKYDLRRFNTINTVSYDHPDPSIFTVLTSPTDTPGIANIDFVIFPERWMVAEHTFRPPYYHRNIMSEYMGLICGVYDAKEGAFVPGGASIHNAFSAHGPDANTFNKAITHELQPVRYKHTLAFMFESSHVWQVTAPALAADFRDVNYLSCWQGLTDNFK